MIHTPSWFAEHLPFRSHRWLFLFYFCELNCTLSVCQRLVFIKKEEDFVWIIKFQKSLLFHEGFDSGCGRSPGSRFLDGLRLPLASGIARSPRYSGGPAPTHDMRAQTSLFSPSFRGTPTRLSTDSIDVIITVQFLQSQSNKFGFTPN